MGSEQKPFQWTAVSAIVSAVMLALVGGSYIFASGSKTVSRDEMTEAVGKVEDRINKRMDGFDRKQERFDDKMDAVMQRLGVPPVEDDDAAR